MAFSPNYALFSPFSHSNLNQSLDLPQITGHIREGLFLTVLMLRVLSWCKFSYLLILSIIFPWIVWPLSCWFTIVYHFFFNNQNLKFLALKVSMMVLKYEGSYGSVTYITNINQFSITLLMLITASVCI